MTRARPAHDATPPTRATIEALQSVELDLLTVLALEDEPMSPTAWKDAAAGYGLRGGPTQALATQALDALAKRLEQAGVLAAPLGPGRFAVHTATALEVLETSHTAGRLAPLAASFERAHQRQRLHWTSVRQTTRLRLGVLLGDPGAAAQAIDQIYSRNRSIIVDFVFEALGVAPRPAWVAHLPSYVRAAYLLRVCEVARMLLLPLEPALIDAALTEDDKELRLEVARLLVLRGEGPRATALGPLPRWGAQGLVLLEAFWRGDYASAAALGQAAVAAMKTRKHKLLPDLEGACHMLALVATCASDPRKAAELGDLLSANLSVSAKGSVDDGVFLALSDVYDTLTGNPRTHETSSRRMNIRAFLPAMVWMLHELWLDDGIADPQLDMLAVARFWHARAVEGGYPPVARELAAIVAGLAGETKLDGEPRLEGETSLAGAFNPPAPWETALASLEAALETSTHTAAGSNATPQQLVWALQTMSDDYLDIQPRLLGSARATKGRAVSLSRLLEGDHAELLDATDRAVLATAELPRRGFGHVRPMLGRRAIVALIDHPRVVSATGAPLKIVRGTPTIVTRDREGHTHVELRPPALLQHELCCERAGPERIVVYERPAALEPLIGVLARGRSLQVPKAARERLARALTRLGSTASVALEGDLEVGAPSQPADPRPLLQLGWDGTTLDVRVRVAPLGPRGPQLQPGAGAASLLGEIELDDGRKLARCERELALEVARHRALLDACPILAGFAYAALQHAAPSLADALDVLLEIDALGDEVTLAWAAGQKLDLPLRAGLEHLHIEVGSGTNWLSLTGSVQLDEGAVLRFTDLLGRPAGARYVPLGHGRFVALSDKLRRHLDALASLGTTHGAGPGKGTELRASPALLSVIDELASQADGFVLGEDVRDKLVAIRELEQWAPRVPRGFQAALRDYQREGYTFGARLGRAGLGACLADDMGLGKTVQALALLCQRASLGPALVVCPTSVVLNWLAEATRFAPTLAVQVLADAGDRHERLCSLGARDVVICSYGLLSTEADALAQIELATVVFDEAHALKNQTTKRAKSARRLRAGFRLALTGTPVENHLGELWSLFDVLIPGLLGTRKHFDERFTAPLAAGDRERTSLLRAILRPFMLRRTKAQVLDELPPRSEITIRVEPYPKQRAFYEALRRQAWDRIATADPKKARLEILAEITRLRQAAIDPRLIDDVDGPEGAKIDALIERLEQLREGGHRALVFTQFLGSMALVRARLATSGIESFELDGSTPMAERARRIEAFQAGEGDVFLLSLRAGGMGVNLTGADYVFHLDPWWNPAVEDQATDRAHRIGQQRPVTLYRLVTEGTIEDKIIALHTTKRQLADDVLAGLERATTPDLEQLRRLLELA